MGNNIPGITPTPQKPVVPPAGQTKMPEVFAGKVITRCKMRCDHNEEDPNSKTLKQYRIILRAVYQQDSPENKEFFAATPSGVLDLSVVNPQAAAGFIVGRFYYVDFEEAA